MDECQECWGLGYWVNRWGPDDNVEQEMCEICRGTGEVPYCKRKHCFNPASSYEGRLVDGYCKQHHEQFIRLLTTMAIDK